MKAILTIIVAAILVYFGLTILMPNFLKDLNSDDETLREKTLRSQIALLENPSVGSNEKLDAANILGDMGALEAVPALIALLDNPDESLARDVARALGKIGDLRAVPALVKTLKNRHSYNSYEVAVNAGKALSRLGGLKAEMALRDALSYKQTHHEVRRCAIHQLGYLAGERALPEIIGMLGDEDELVREEAVFMFDLILKTSISERALTDFALYPSRAQRAASVSAIKKSLLSSRSGDWKQALKELKVARKSTPSSPIVLYNLAVACQRIGNRDIEALCWYRAFLASAAGSGIDKRQVWKVLQSLENRVEKRIIKSAINAGDNKKRASLNNIQFFTRKFVGLHMNLHNWELARKAVNAFPEEQRDSILKNVAEVHHSMHKRTYGRDSKSRFISWGLQMPSYKAHAEAVLPYAKKGDLYNALKQISEIKSWDERIKTLENLAIFLAIKGELKPAIWIAESLPVRYASKAYFVIAVKSQKKNNWRAAMIAFWSSLALDYAEEQAFIMYQDLGPFYNARMFGFYKEAAASLYFN